MGVPNPVNRQNRYGMREAAAAQKLIAFKTYIRNLISANGVTLLYHPEAFDYITVDDLKMNQIQYQYEKLL